jgi:hypothetical protein
MAAAGQDLDLGKASDLVTVVQGQLVDADSMPIKALALQIRVICTSESAPNRSQPRVRNGAPSPGWDIRRAAGRAAARRLHRYRWPGGLARLVATMSPIQERDGRPEALGMQVTDD